MNEKKCVACGASVDAMARECKYCGEALPVQEQTYQQPPQFQQQPPQYQNMNNNSPYAYLKPYYQDEFSKIDNSNGAYKGRWNWCAFLFSWIWAFTKGLWGLALINLGINIILVNTDASFISFAFAIFWGLRGNYVYHNLQTTKTQFPKNL